MKAFLPVLRRAAALGLSWLLAASPARAGYVLLPGPAAVGGVAAPAAPPAPTATEEVPLGDVAAKE